MTDIRERLIEEMKNAMRKKEKLRLSTIRMIRSEILNKDKEHGEEASEEDILKLLQTMVKRREEAATQYDNGGRADLAQKERDEVEIVKSYLPAQMSVDEIRKEVQAAIEELGASSMKDMGKVMGVLTKKLAGRATGSAVSDAVKELLAG